MSIMPPEPDSKSNPPRKAIPKRVRFEVLRRDDYTCKYCRSTDNPLTIDHVVPAVLGGTDDPSNLVAACKDCNAGKSSSSPDAGTVAQVSDDAARWAAAMKLAAERLAQNKAAASEQMRPFFDEWYVMSGPGWAYKLPADAEDVLAKYLAAGMPPDSLRHAARIALRKRDVDNYFRYFQGVANNMLAELQRDAAALLSAPDLPPSEVADPGEDQETVWWRKGFDDAFSLSLVPEFYIQARALSRVVDGENVWNRKVSA